MGRVGRARRRACAVGVMVAVALGSACSGAGERPEPEPAPSRTHQKAGAAYWVNPDGNAARQAAAFRAAGQQREAELIQRIATRPSGEWLGGGDAEHEARGVTGAAAGQGKSALLVLYNLPHRDCGQYSRGGAQDATAYRAWLDGVVRGIDDRPATVIVEPDALPHLLQPGCTPEEFHEERYALLREAVDRLKALPRTKVYLDGGNPGFGQDRQALAEALRRAGVKDADGFSVNVSNFFTTQASTDYGRHVSDLLAGPHFVIDTSRNGNGPWQGEEEWCNPPGRALGEAPADQTADPLVDAYLWIKRPGESDGPCRGGPPAGQWWQEYALELARNTK
ncbi:glycoside hydrolase family 6 protein [Streptomyces sp. NPDC051940]|uniref:glycoside hydrolase family 6 protein n=1 Tax=Streptomyces sp. NPDC051940 TaxID=3155675 RepID=UPI00342A21BF